MPSQSVDPRTGQSFGPELPESTDSEVDACVELAVEAEDAWAAFDGPSRGKVLEALAGSLDARADALADLADRETGLGLSRLVGEVGRTTFQLREFARVAERGSHLGIVVSPESPEPPPVGHPDLRRMLMPIGPVAVYGASNFPFAFSVLGGDTAAALAAGCPVVVKAHPSHPQTSDLVGEIATGVLLEAGCPPGTLGVVRGLDAGVRLVQHPGIRAAAFTGSTAGGRALFDLAVGRPDPIPFYGELGSVNPVVVSPGAASEPEALVRGYVESLCLGAGQFCTNPGLILVPAASGLAERIVGAVRGRAEMTLLNEGTVRNLRLNVESLTAVEGVRSSPGQAGGSLGGMSWTPEALVVAAGTALANPRVLRTECFGPVGIVVEYSSEDELLRLIGSLDGCLVSTVHAREDEPLAAVLISRLSRISGRVVWNEWPTGLAVTAAQHHGGPHPATTNSLHSSVGTSSIRRFLRPISFQSMPISLLPAELR